MTTTPARPHPQDATITSEVDIDVDSQHGLPVSAHGLTKAWATALSAIEPAGYAGLRMAYGAIVFTHGLPKLLGNSHGSMADPMAGSVRMIREVMGLPFAPQLALLVMLVETLGALLLAAGLWTRPVAAMLTLEMLGICLALGPTWPWIDRGIEYPVLLAALAAYFAVRGGGVHALDAVLSRRRSAIPPA